MVKRLALIATLLLAPVVILAQGGGQFGGATTGGGSAGVSSISGDGTVITNSGSTGAVTLTFGSVPLSGISGATTTPTAAASGNNTVTFNWAQTSNNQAGITFGETSAATGGTLTNSHANQAEVTFSTASGSTATPFNVLQGSITGTVAFPAAQVRTTFNNASLVGEAVLVQVTETADAANTALFDIQGGAAGTTSAFKVFGVNTNNGYTMQFGNQYSLFNIAGGTLAIENLGETNFQPVQAGGFKASDGWASGNMFGSFMYVKPEPCETNFAATTVNTGSATTTTGLSCITANSMIIDVVYRITTTITTAASFTVGITGSTSKFCTSQATLTAGTTGHCYLQVNAGAMQNTAAAQVVVTFNTTPGAGALRIIAYNLELTAPTS